MWFSKTRQGIVALCLLSVACDPYTETTVVKTRNAMQVGVQDADSESHVPPNWDQVLSAEVARTEVQTGPSSTSDLVVIASRRPGGGLVTEWQTRLPLLNGERHTLLDSSGVATLDGHITVDTTSEHISIPVCGTLQQSSVKGRLVGYNVVPAQPCTESHMTQINLETPKSNLESVTQVSTNDVRGIAIFSGTMNTIIFGGLGSLLAFANLRDKDGNVQPAGVRGVGVGLLAIGAGIDIALIPAIFAPNKENVVYQK